MQDFVATQLPQILRLEGTQDAPVVGVTVQGVTFSHSAPAFMEKLVRRGEKKCLTFFAET